MDEEAFSFGFGFVIGAILVGIPIFGLLSGKIDHIDHARKNVWREAIVRGYAEQLETEDGKPAYRWKEK